MAEELDPWSLHGVSTSDDYTDVATLRAAPPVTGIRVAVINALVYYQLEQDGREWLPEKPLEPWVGMLTIAPSTTGVRFRSAYTGQPALINATLLFAGETQTGAPAPYTVDSSGTVQTIGSGAGVTGDIIWSAASARAGAVLCDGTHYDGTNPTYAALYATIGLTFGGTAQSDFAVPDLRDRVPVGAGGNTARAANEGIAAANRHGPRHRHTVSPVSVITAAAGGSDLGAGSHAAGGITVGAATSDPLDGPAYLGLNAFILL